MKFYEEKDLAVCGLACMLCSEEACPGCKAQGCKDADVCSVYKCATGRGLDGCYQCEEFPCGEKVLAGIRIRAFNRYAKQYGKQSLMDRLRMNYENGILYHSSKSLSGDYDLCRTEQEVIALLKNGKPNPYSVLPNYESKHFLLRFVSLEDTVDLLECYQDPKAYALFNSDNCNTDFVFKTADELKKYIEFWIRSYEKKEFVRFSIVDKALEKAVGTIEIFGMIGAYHSPVGILRLDICSQYEKVAFLNELLQIADGFFYEFGCEKIVTKAVPHAFKRIEALTQNGYIAYPANEEWGRKDYYIKENAQG